ncbi:hypothetical protein L1987_64182 [Smallanthus sonchifolius]|uniref:Uncharacterized protein n=1 Tax=Smallanthus sonchifolius TaxID=185202 RepID=A0ACB9CFA2_9ASTR|nr:hypothetical protein L1987_64182 [Smallanthus sonchifolius]
MWKDFDARILRYKVLPPLCAELRNMVMQPMILPMVLKIADSQDKVDFKTSTLPALVPVLSTAAGETLLLLVKHAELVVNKASHEHLVSHVLPMLVRAYDDTDVRMQEEVLKKTVSLATKLDSQHEIDFVVEHVLPLLVPLLLAQQLNVQQFAKYMSFIKSILRKVEEKKGITTNDGST